jgi:hypothetical protein
MADTYQRGEVPVVIISLSEISVEDFRWSPVNRHRVITMIEVSRTEELDTVSLKRECVRSSHRACEPVRWLICVR